MQVDLNKIMIKIKEGVRYDMCKAVDYLRESGR